jgi:hypothetical protein
MKMTKKDRLSYSTIAGGTMNRDLNWRLFFMAGCLWLLASSQAGADCTGSSPTWNSTADQASLESCLGKRGLQSGDTINVAPGTITLSARVNGPKGKCVKLVGAGIGKTILSRPESMADAHSLYLFTTPGCVTEVTGFTFDANNDLQPVGSSVLTIDSGSSQGVSNFHVHHNAFININRRGLRLLARGVIASGLVDSNTFSAGNGKSAQAIWGNNCSNHADDASNAVMNVARDWGGPLAIYVEDNTFTATAEQDGSLDGYSCGRVVQRYNDLHGWNLGSHGTDGNRRGTTHQEYYGNSLSGDTIAGRSQSGRIAHIRSGNVIMFDNRIASSVPGTISILMYRVCDLMKTCDRARNWVYSSCAVTAWGGPNERDGRLGGSAAYSARPKGYPCLDQVGWVFDQQAGQGGTFTRQPSYAWNNIRNGANVPITLSNAGPLSETDWFLEDYDFFNQSESFKGTAGIGRGPIGARPSCSTDYVAYWATDEGEWNSTNGSAPDGKMYVCLSGVWTARYGGNATGLPYVYPHPLRAAGR